jgi:hypothetical protein
MNIKEIEAVTESAKLLSSSHYDMTVQAISDECGILKYEYGVAVRNATPTINSNSEDRERLLRAIAECDSAMREAEDCLEINYNRIPTNL